MPLEHSKKTKDPIYERIENMLTLFITIGIILGSILIIQDYFEGHFVTLYASIAFIVFLILDIVYIRVTKNYKFGAIVSLSALAILFFALLLYGDGRMFVWLPVITLAYFFFGGNRYGFSLALAVYILTSIIFLLDGLGVIDIPFTTIPIELAPDFLASVFLLLLFVYFIQEYLEHQRAVISHHATELEEEAQKDRAVFSTIEMGVAIVDKNGVVSFMNRSGLNLLGATANEIIGKHVEDVFKFSKRGKALPPKQNPLNLQNLKDGKTLRVRLYDNIMLEKLSGKISNESFPVGLNVTRSDTNPETALTIVFFDLTNEQKVSQLKDAFLSSMQHEISTPFATIQWNLEILGESPEKLKEIGVNRDEVLEETRNAVLRITRTQDEILTVSRIEQGFFPQEIETIDIKEIITEIIKESEYRSKKKRVEVRERYADKIEPIKANKTIVRLILRNLVSNAIKYSKEEGVVTVIVRSDNGNVIIEVADHGIGIPKHDQANIFSKFFRAENAVDIIAEGTGLGLFITKTLVDHMGGKIWFKSDEGKGTIFYVILPKNPESKSNDDFFIKN